MNISARENVREAVSTGINILLGDSGNVFYEVEETEYGLRYEINSDLILKIEIKDFDIDKDCDIDNVCIIDIKPAEDNTASKFFVSRLIQISHVLQSMKTGCVTGCMFKDLPEEIQDILKKFTDVV